MYKIAASVAQLGKQHFHSCLLTHMRGSQQYKRKPKLQTAYLSSWHKLRTD